ncbi:MAG: M20/M25/M40 family metallo-hydrolase, partial [Nitrososphaerota archaeon]|nr:M20/M25/M40 family metallo-hydrolase [Nitrososphaerota archaeon]
MNDDIMRYEERVLGDLVAISSDLSSAGGYERCAGLIKEEVEGLGYPAEIMPSSGGAPRPNVKVEIAGAGPILLASHFDTVPIGPGWTTDPLRLVKTGDKLYGRGSADDKGAVAVMLGTLKSIDGASRLKTGLTLCFTADEEVGGAMGLGDLINRLNGLPAFAIIADAGSGKVSCGASGIVNGEIIIRGKQGHAGYPHLARNPIQKVPVVLGALEELSARRERLRSSLNLPEGQPHRKVWGRLSPTIISGGFKNNVIPPTVTITFDMRLLPEEDMNSAMAELRGTIEKLAKAGLADVELGPFEGGGNYHTDPGHPLVREFLKVAEAQGCGRGCVGELVGNDGRYTSRKGIPTVGLGVIDDDSNIHGPDEFV